MLDAARLVNSRARFFQASSSHIFEGTDRSPQSEDFEFSPKSPYARSKADALQMVREYRESGKLFACSAILYNHESPLRSDHFVTRKVSKAVARIAAGKQDVLELGDIEVARDWGWAPDYVRAMKLMLEADAPRDYVLATGISHRLSFFVQKAFAAVGIPHWQEYVVTKASDRPVDTNKMVGDSRSAYLNLGWRHTVDFDSIAQRMVEHDVALLEDPEALWEDF
jgi:GDPmannose 4,6-dehydratase